MQWKLNLTAILLFFCLTSRGQNIQETVDYINDKLSHYKNERPLTNKTNRSPLIDVTNGNLIEDMFLYSYYSSIKLTSEGILYQNQLQDEYVIRAGASQYSWQTDFPDKTGKIINSDQYNCPIQELSSVVMVEQQPISDFWPCCCYYIELSCKSGNCVEYLSIDGTSKKADAILGWNSNRGPYEKMTFLICGNEDIANRIKNAFAHLIELSQNNNNFKAQDPFK